MIIIDTVRKLFERRFIRYCFAGGVAAITDLSIFFIANEIFKIYYVFCLVISFSIAAGANYALQRRITFKNKYKKKHKQFFVFLVIQIVGLFFNGVATVAQVELLGFWPTLARFISIFIVLIYTYWTNKKITFNLMR